MKYFIWGALRTATKIEMHVAPGLGNISALSNLNTCPADDWGNWVIGGETSTLERNTGFSLLFVLARAEYRLNPRFQP
jgi:hypothetical protein